MIVALHARIATDNRSDEYQSQEAGKRTLRPCRKTPIRDPATTSTRPSGSGRYGHWATIPQNRCPYLTRVAPRPDQTWTLARIVVSLVRTSSQSSVSSAIRPGLPLCTLCASWVPLPRTESSSSRDSLGPPSANVYIKRIPARKTTRGGKRRNCLKQFQNRGLDSDWGHHPKIQQLSRGKCLFGAEPDRGPHPPTECYRARPPGGHPAGIAIQVPPKSS